MGPHTYYSSTSLTLYLFDSLLPTLWYWLRHSRSFLLLFRLVSLLLLIIERNTQPTAMYRLFNNPFILILSIRVVSGKTLHDLFSLWKLHLNLLGNRGQSEKNIDHHITRLWVWLISTPRYAGFWILIKRILAKSSISKLSFLWYFIFFSLRLN